MHRQWAAGNQNKTTKKGNQIMLANIMIILAEQSGNFALGVAGAGAGIGVGLVGFGATQAVGRNPGAFGKILTIGIIGMALAEAIAIYGLLMALKT
jgi:F-type H+-transporting ATPase subunit c